MSCFEDSEKKPNKILILSGFGRVCSGCGFFDGMKLFPSRSVLNTIGLGHIWMNFRNGALAMYFIGFILYILVCIVTIVKICSTKTFVKNEDASRMTRKKVKSLEYIGYFWAVSFLLQIIILVVTSLFSGLSIQGFFKQTTLLVSLLSAVQVASLVIHLLISSTLQSVKANKLPMLLISMIIVIVGTNFFFGLIYEFLLRSNLTIIQSLYFSFAINYSLPLQGDTYNSIQKQINENNLFMLVQIGHITISKIAELVLLGIVVSKISERFQVEHKSK